MRLLLAIAVASAMSISAAMAQMTCMPRPVLAQQLKDSTGQVLIQRGATVNGNLIEVFANDGGDWVIILTRSDLFSCIVAIGFGWEQATVPDTEL